MPSTRLDAGRGKNFQTDRLRFCHAELLLARITRQEVYGTQILRAISSRRQRHEENFDAGVEAIEQHVKEYADRKCGQLERLPRRFSCGKAPADRIM
jgi:hypothetical protein